MSCRVPVYLGQEVGLGSAREAADTLRMPWIFTVKYCSTLIQKIGFGPTICRITMELRRKAIGRTLKRFSPPTVPKEGIRTTNGPEITRRIFSRSACANGKQKFKIMGSYNNTSFITDFLNTK